MNHIDFFTLKGKIITEILRPNDFSIIKTSDGSGYYFHHIQDCCESVNHYITIGDINNIIGFPITLAESDNKEPIKCDLSYGGTWSSFYLETEKGKVEWYFIGTSNGYYGETVELYKSI